MNKDQFFNRHQNNQIHEAELERKWRLFQEQQAQEQWLLEAAAAAAGSASSVGGAGGGGTTTPQSLVKNGQSVSLLFTNQDLPNYQCVTGSANGLNGKVTIADIQVPASASIFGSRCINNGGTIFYGTYFDSNVNASLVFFSLVDADGNHVMTDTVIDDEDWDLVGFEGNIVAWGYYLNNEGLGDTYQARWWDGFNINTQIFTNVDFVSWSQWSSNDETLDGTISIGVNTTDSLNSKYMLRINGDCIRYDDKLRLPDGRTPDSTRAENGNNSIRATYYNDNDNRYDILKILKTDGSVYTLDISDWDVTNIDFYSNGFGTTYITTPAVNTSDVAIISWDETLNTFEVYNAGPAQNIINRDVESDNIDSYFDYDNSPEAWNNIAVILYGAATNDGKMDRYNSLRIIYKFAGDPLQVFNISGLANPTSFGFSYNSSHCATPTFLCNTNGASELQILTLSPDGYRIQDTGTAYADAGTYFDVRAMGKYSILSWYNTDRPSSEEQTFQILEDYTIVDTILTSTANSWDTNYDTAWVRQDDEELTYYFTPAAGEWLNFGPNYADRWYSNDTNGTLGRDFAYVGGHNFGTTAFNTSGDNYAVLTRETVDNIDTWAPSGNPTIRVANKHIIVIDVVDVDGDDVYQILFIDTEGNIVNTVNTHNDTNYDYWIISERVVFVQATGDGDYHVFSCTPTGYTEKTFVGSIQETAINDIRWRD